MLHQLDFETSNIRPKHMGFFVHMKMWGKDKDFYELHPQL
jgi:hypothetical protein